MRVFIVEDDINLARALQKILQDNGYEVDTVHSGTEGLSWAESGYYDVVMLDVMLPGMDGFEVSRQLRRAGVSTPHFAADRPRRGAGQNCRAGFRRRRLHDQALLAGRADGPPAGAHPPLRRRGVRAAAAGRCGA